MTVTELMAAIQAAYPGATAEALKAYVPVFFKRFRAREGEALKDAADEVFAAFKPTTRQPFPIPADFEPHLPGPFKAPEAGDAGPSIKMALQGRTERADWLYRGWMAEQGLKIKAARHPDVYGACVLLALDLCRRSTQKTQRVLLTAEQIELCEMRALSSARARRHGPLPATNEAWQQQIADIRAEWSATPQAEAA